MAALGFAAGGCADNDSALFIRSVLALEGGGDCVAVAQPEAKFLAFGVLDVSFRQNYFANLLVGNQLARQGNSEKVRTETARIALRGADVEVKRIDGSVIVAFATDGAGFVDPGSATDPGYGIMAAELLPPGAVSEADGRVNVSVRVVGETLGGTSIESSELIFPISICRGCLLSIPAGAYDELLGACTGDPTEDAPCIRGQDEPVDCRLCAGEPACDPTP